MSDLTWYSSDWTVPPNQRPPFNGLKLVAQPAYSQSGRLTSLIAAVYDHTLEAQGAAQTLTFASVADGAAQQFIGQADFTARGTVRLRRYRAEPNHLVITFESVMYGLPDRRRMVEGGIMLVPTG